MKNIAAVIAVLFSFNLLAFTITTHGGFGNGSALILALSGLILGVAGIVHAVRELSRIIGTGRNCCAP